MFVLDGHGNDTINGPGCGTYIVDGSGGYTFSGPASAGNDFIFTGDSELGEANITETTSGPVIFDFSGLGEGIDLDLAQGGQSGGPVSVNVTLDNNLCTVYGTPYDDTIQTSRTPEGAWAMAA